MGESKLDITSSLSWEEGLPRPQWDLLEAWIESQGDPAAWTTAARQWLAHLADALGDPYTTAESNHFLLVVPDEKWGSSLLDFALATRGRILSVLSGVAGFDTHGKDVAIVFRNQDDYYRYVGSFTPEGEQGASGGMQIREGYDHIALHTKDLFSAEGILAHEMTHSGLMHLGMPQWIEEGLAQTFEHDMTRRGMLMVDAEMATRHNRYWGKHGLDDFWRGDGFSRSGKVQELSYQLAEILMRLMLEDARPRWFGFVKEPQQRFFAFLREAARGDCGEAAAQAHLKCSLSDIAARFLGPGDWSPSL